MSACNPPDYGRQNGHVASDHNGRDSAGRQAYSPPMAPPEAGPPTIANGSGAEGGPAPTGRSLGASRSRISAALDDAGLTPFEFRIWAHLARRADAQGLCYPTTEGITITTGIRRTKVFEVLASLEKRGLIERRASSGKRTVYLVTHPTSPDTLGGPPLCDIAPDPSVIRTPPVRNTDSTRPYYEPPRPYYGRVHYREGVPLEGEETLRPPAETPPPSNQVRSIPEARTPTLQACLTVTAGRYPRALVEAAFRDLEVRRWIWSKGRPHTDWRVHLETKVNDIIDRMTPNDWSAAIERHPAQPANRLYGEPISAESLADLRCLQRLRSESKRIP